MPAESRTPISMFPLKPRTPHALAGRVTRLVLLLLFASTMCRQDAHGQAVEPVELPQELDRVLRDYERAWQSGNADALADLFTADGFVRRDGRWIRGRDSIRVAYENAGGPLRLRAVSYAADDSVGYMVGQYGYGTAADVSYRGSFVLALRRSEDGHWLIAADLDH